MKLWSAKILRQATPITTLPRHQVRATVAQISTAHPQTSRAIADRMKVPSFSISKAITVAKVAVAVGTAAETATPVH